MAFVVGLTGGIGSGKTAVSDILEKNGISIIDADVVSRNVTSDGTECAKKMALAFPSCVVDGKINRRLLRAQVFSNPETVNQLNAITHPYITNEIKQMIKNSEGLVVLVAPLLFEVGLEKECDYLVCVTCNMQDRIKRIQNRDNIERTLAELIIANQTDDDEKTSKCDYVLKNDGTYEELLVKVQSLISVLMEAKNKN